MLYIMYSLPNNAVTIGITIFPELLYIIDTFSILHVRMKIGEVKESKFKKNGIIKKSESGGEMNKVKFTQEFKEDAVKYYHSSGKSVREVSEELGIGKSTLDNWIRKSRHNDGKIEVRGSGNYASDKDKEISKLQKELKDTKDALEILKKAMGILNN